ncbi:MAG: dihydrofolate reductase family protein [Eubacteriales bacterium]
MDRKIVLSLAMSVDGFISDLEGGFDWIAGDGGNALNTVNQWDYKAFLEGIDIVVMGKNCYDQKMHEDFKDKKVFVATSKPLTDYDNIHFISGDICRPILEERKLDGKDIFLFGGGLTIDSFIAADLIDEYIIGIVPIILGKGRPLFAGSNPTIELKLDTYSISSGVAVLYYSKRKGN